MAEINFDATYVTMYTTGEPMTEKPENLRAWIAALRSGDYRQGVSDLGRIRTYVIDEETDEQVDLDDPVKEHCCLGVACELSGEGTWGDMGLGSKASGEYFGADTLEWLGFPRPVRDPSIEWSVEVQIQGEDDRDRVANAFGWKSGRGPIRWDEGHWVGLETLNDNAEFSFEDIADYIERYPLRYIKS